MKKKYKMIVLDLDGTLTNNKKVITPKTKNAYFNTQKNISKKQNEEKI